MDLSLWEFMFLVWLLSVAWLMIGLYIGTTTTRGEYFFNRKQSVSQEQEKP